MTAPRPVRLRLSRKKGFDLQALSRELNGLDAVSVARPTKWGNPYVVGERHGDAHRCVALFRSHLEPLLEARRRAGLDALRELRGKNLACFCDLAEPCHADVLLELANTPICEAV